MQFIADNYYHIIGILIIGIVIVKYLKKRECIGIEKN